jgi:predicted amidohydrolase
MKVAVIQNDPEFGRKKENLLQALRMMSSVSADIYILPELFASGYNFLTLDEVRSLAEHFRRGETFDALKEFAVAQRAYVVYGFPEADKSMFYNSAAILGFDGLEGLYRKIHLFDREKLFFQPGDLGFKVFPTPLGKIGLMICFDWYFPESVRTLAGKGAQLIAHPSNLVLPHCPNSMPTRSLENRVFIATANRVGVEDRQGLRLSYIGQSQITSLKGEILHRAASDKPEIFSQEINISDADNKNLNERNHLFNDRRPEFYLR